MSSALHVCHSNPKRQLLKEEIKAKTLRSTCLHDSRQNRERFLKQCSNSTARLLTTSHVFCDKTYSSKDKPLSPEFAYILSPLLLNACLPLLSPQESLSSLSERRLDGRAWEHFSSRPPLVPEQVHFGHSLSSAGLVFTVSLLQLHPTQTVPAWCCPRTPSTLCITLTCLIHPTDLSSVPFRLEVSFVVSLPHSHPFWMLSCLSLAISTKGLNLNIGSDTKGPYL